MAGPQDKIPCPCCSGKTFEKCCRPHVTGAVKPKTIKQTMRARYTAYALGGYGEFLFHTWHPEFRKGLTPNTLAQKTTDWQSLSVGEFKQEGDRGAIEFKAIYKEPDGELKCHHEISQFLRNKGLWYYTAGNVEILAVEDAREPPISQA